MNTEMMMMRQEMWNIEIEGTLKMLWYAIVLIVVALIFTSIGGVFFLNYQLDNKLYVLSYQIQSGLKLNVLSYNLD